MLYLAEVKKQKKRFLGRWATELKLLAVQNTNQRWKALPGEEKIPAEEAQDLGDGALVIVNIDKNQKIQGTLEPAARQVVRVLQNFSALVEKSKDQEEKIEQWKPG